MKRTFVYLVLVLTLSLLLCACGDTTDHGNVSTSPWPDVNETLFPVPSILPSISPSPEVGIENDADRADNDRNPDTRPDQTAAPENTADIGNAATSSPSPGETGR